MKSKLIISLATCTLSGCAITSAVAVGVTANSNNLNKPLNTDNRIEYCTVTFKGQEGVTFLGQTQVKVEKGSYFASVRVPTAQYGKYKFDHWSKKQGGTAINPKEIIEDDTDIWAVFQEETDLSKCVGISAIDNTTITIKHLDGSSGDIAQDLDFSTNFGQDWENINADTDHAIELEPGESVYFKGTNLNGFNTSATDGIYFDVSEGGSVNIAGNIMGLLDDGVGSVETTIPNSYCFANLFKGTDTNYGIRYVSDAFLPADTLTANCYDSMFMGQKTLLSAPWLPASTLENNCYQNIFNGCSALNFIKISYTGDFNINGSYPYTTGWVQGIANDGTIIYDGDDNNPSPDKTGSGIPDGPSTQKTTWTINKSPVPEHYDDGITITCENEPEQFVDNHPYDFDATVEGEGAIYQEVTWVSSDTSIATVNPATGVVTPVKEGTCTISAYSKIDQTVGGQKEISVREIDAENQCTKFTTTSDSATIDWNFGGTGAMPNFKYSKDGKNWFTFTAGEPITIYPTTPIYVKGNNPNGLGIGMGPSESHTRFIFDLGDVSVAGSINGLIDDGCETLKTIPCQYCFNQLFSKNDYLVGVSENYLSNIETLSEGCYGQMFQYCPNLVTAPKLPNENLQQACYVYMFRGCTSLEAAPELNASELAKLCYKDMFYECKSLTETPTLDAEIAAQQCYLRMFYGCTGLTKINNIGLQTLGLESCSQMFYGVSSTLFTNDETLGGTTFFTCPQISGQNAVLNMFRFDESDTTVDPLPGDTWYYLS